MIGHELYKMILEEAADIQSRTGIKATNVFLGRKEIKLLEMFVSESVAYLPEKTLDGGEGGDMLIYGIDKESYTGLGIEIGKGGIK